MQVKASFRNSRTGKKGQLCCASHNDRSKGLGEHIHQDRMDENEYYVNVDGHIKSIEHTNYKNFEEFEKSYYEKFQKHLDAQNQKYIERRQQKRIIKNEKGEALTAPELYLKSKKTAPMETIMQIGDSKTPMDDTTRKELTRKAFASWLKNYISPVAGGHYQVMDFAIHMDEATPHIHLRGCFVNRDADGHPELAQNRAIKAIKERCPDIFKNARNPSGKRGDKDLIALTDYMRNSWYDAIERTARAMNLDVQIDRDVQNPGAVHKEIMEYKLEQLQAEIENSQNNFETLQWDIDQQKERLAKNQNLINKQRNQYNELTDDYNSLVDRHKELKTACNDLIEECDELAAERQDTLDNLLDNTRDAHLLRQLQKRFPEAMEQMQEQLSHPQRQRQRDNDFYER